MNFFEILGRILGNSGYANISWQQAVMLLISFVLLYLAIVKQFEPLLLLPIAYGIFMSNLPNSGTFYYFYNGEVEHWYEAGILGVMYMGVKSSFFPCMMFLAVGAMTDFGPLIANPISLCLGAAAQLGIYCAFMFANAIGLFTPQQAAAIGVIGGADGPTAIYCANNLAPELVAPIAVAAYSYMALIPLIQPPIMMALTTDKERHVKMTQLRKVTKTEKIIFPVMVACLVSLLLPDVAPLLGMLMLGNLFRESGVVERLSDVAQNALCNICTIFLGLSVGATAPDSGHRRHGSLRLLPFNRRRPAAGQAALRHHRRKDQPAHRFRRRFCSADGSPCVPDCGRKGRPYQLPSDARHGPERGRRHRFRSCSRLLPDFLQALIAVQKV